MGDIVIVAQRTQDGLENVELGKYGESYEQDTDANAPKAQCARYGVTFYGFYVVHIFDKNCGKGRDCYAFLPNIYSDFSLFTSRIAPILQQSENFHCLFLPFCEIYRTFEWL